MTTTDTTPGALAPLWSDARIDKAAMDDWNYSTSYEAARSALRKMRDEYEAALEAERNSSRIDFANAAAYADQLQEMQRDLEAARSASAGQYEPLPNGTYHTDGPEILSVENGRVHLISGGEIWRVDLQRDMALCCRVPVGEQPA